MKRAMVALCSLMLALFMLTAGGLRAWASGQGHSSGGSSSASNPPGNNGTVKIDDWNVDSGQDNDPHVTCDFSVSFFGFDGGHQTASVTITPVAPTPGSGGYTTSANLSGTRPPGNTLDGSIQVSQTDLSSALNGVTPQPNQGYHLRLDVTVDGGNKHKVFWLEPCTPHPFAAPPASFGANQSMTTTSRSPTTASSSSGTSSGGSLVFGPELSAGTLELSGGTLASSTASSSGTSGASGASPSSQGSSPVTPQAAKPSAAATAPASKLAFTGTDISGLVVFGLALIGSGFMLLRWRRKA